MYKTLPDIEKRLDALINQECKRGLFKKEEDEFIYLRDIARQLRINESFKKPLTQVRNEKIEKIKSKMINIL